MAWFKTDDQLHGHPKPRKAGLEAMGLWIVSGSHSMAYKGDGFVPAWYVESWPKGKRLAGQLIVARMWHLDTDTECPFESPTCVRPPIEEAGWWFHDWLDYQPTVEEIERDREAARIRQKARRDRLRSGVINGTQHA